MQNGIILTLGAFATVNAMGWLTPGPNMLAIISAAVSSGRRAGIMTAFGVSLGGMLWAVFALAGAATLFEVFPNAVFTLRLAGAGYLLWLGYKALRSTRSNAVKILESYNFELSDRQAFRTGFIVIATNPKAAIFFVSIFAAFVPENAPVWLLVTIVVFSAVQSTAQHCITASVFSTRRVVNAFQAAGRAITAVFGLLYAGLGIAAAYDAIRRI